MHKSTVGRVLIYIATTSLKKVHKSQKFKKEVVEKLKHFATAPFFDFIRYDDFQPSMD